MHHTRKKKALALIGETTDPIEITKLLLDNQFTDEEVSEVIAELGGEGETSGSETAGPETEQPPVTAPAPPTKAKTVPSGKQSNYKVYDLWSVDISRRERANPANPREKIVEIESFTAIKQLRKNVKLEQSVVNDLNAQSHNSQRRYYESGSITNGNTEKVNITTAE